MDEDSECTTCELFQKRFQEVDPKISEINRRGFLTVSYQQGAKDARSMIIGFMLSGEAESFVKDLNLNTDKMAFIISERKSTSIPVTRHLAERDDYQNGKYTALSSAQLYRSRAEINILLKEAGLSPQRFKKDVNLVAVVDPVWGRSFKGLFKDVIKSLYWFDNKCSKHG